MQGTVKMFDPATNEGLVVRDSDREELVLASDATHFYENWRTNRPFTTAFHIGEMLDAYRTLERLAPTPRHIVPGHDPAVFDRFTHVSDRIVKIE